MLLKRASFALGEASIATHTTHSSHRGGLLRIAFAPRSLSSSSSAIAMEEEKSETPSVKTPRSSKSIDKMYQKKTPIEHVLLRPGMYVGSTNRVTERKFVVRNVEDFLGERRVAKARLAYEEIEYIPALVKIFDEVLVNACDNVVRDPERTRRIDVSFDAAKREFSVRNDGRGIPVQIHKKEKMYIPEMVLGHLLTGSNFDENSDTGGRNGYGAKLCNILSNSFTVETVDTEAGLKFFKRWEGNMSPTKSSPAVVTPLSREEISVGGYTKITFVPDLTRFDVKSDAKQFDSGSLRVIQTRVIETSALFPNLTVRYNDKEVLLPKSALQMFSLYLKQEHAARLANDSSTSTRPYRLNATSGSSGWRVMVGNPTWLEGDAVERSFKFNSFVNGMSVHRGGVHVETIADQISKFVAEEITEPKVLAVSPADVKRNLFLMVTANNVTDPEFDSQSKDRMTRFKNEGSVLKFSHQNLRRLVEGEREWIDSIKANVRERLERSIKRQTGSAGSGTSGSQVSSKILQIPKLEDAGWAGKKDLREKATLILTEGDSAKALAVAGLSVVGREAYGVYPLRGKFLNVRDVSLGTLAQNAEVTNLMTILGLDMKMDYDQPETEPLGLRYGRVMLMTDQDFDGSHIKGLIINMFDRYWPNLLRRNGFLCQFVTPLMKAFPRQGGSGTSEKWFYSIGEYEKWKRENFGEGEEADARLAKAYRVKYYKGLGTSTATEARAYFSNLDSHVVPFLASPDRRKDSNLVDMAFSKARADDRKTWLSAFEALGQKAETIESEGMRSLDSNIDVSPAQPPRTSRGKKSASATSPPTPSLPPKRGITYSEFVEKELIDYSWHDLERSIPSSVDGLKPSQRKVLHACLRRVNEEIKVAQLGGHVAETTAYHHGEASLHATIVNMAQSYVGANNLNLLEPNGQFGTRAQGGKDAASPRYLFTKLSKITRFLFPKEDDELLDYRWDDGVKIEPRVFYPVIPLVLVNGCEGIGTGWSTFIPPHHPLEVIDAVMRMLADGPQDIPELKPWVRNFTGEIVKEKEEDKYWLTKGRVRLITPSSSSAAVAVVEELPVGRWTEDFKGKLAEMVKGGTVASFKEMHKGERIHFHITLSPPSSPATPPWTPMRVEEEFKMKTRLQTNNMVLFNANGKITTFEKVSDVLGDFFPARMEMYERRVKRRREELRKELSEASAQLEILRLVVEKKIEIRGVSREAIRGEFDRRGFGGDKWKLVDAVLSKPIFDLTSERVREVEKKIEKLQADLRSAETSTPAGVWRDELARLREEVNKFYAVEEEVVGNSNATDEDVDVDEQDPTPKASSSSSSSHVRRGRRTKSKRK